MFNSANSSRAAAVCAASSFTIPENLLRELEALAVAAAKVSEALKPAAEALKAASDSLKESFALAIRAALRRTFKQFKSLENSLRSLNSKPKLESFLGVAQRLFSRLTIHSQSSNSPPLLVARELSCQLASHSNTERLKRT
jgi:hypothetical protein